MDGRGGQQQQRPSKSAVYQNPALSAALTSNSLRPSASAFLFILSLFSASLFAIILSHYRGNEDVAIIGLGYVSQDVAGLGSMVIQTTASFIFLRTLLALSKAI